MSEKGNVAQETAQYFRDVLADAIKNAKTDERAFEQNLEERTDLITVPSNEGQFKELIGLQTSTFLDELFLNSKDSNLNGIPIVGQFGIVGLSGVGKSLLAQEMVLQLINKGKKVVFVTSEDIWSIETRYDLQSRMMEKASNLQFNWNKIKDNLYILDSISHSQLREWEMFVSTYRTIVEKNKIDVVVIDSITLMETTRGMLKTRILELSRYNQLHGITGIYICQRAEEETDRFGIAGGIGVAHNLDSVICIDFAKASGQMKEDLAIALNKQIKQWDLVHFVRVLSCRLCGFDRKYFPLEITKQGFLRKITQITGD